MQMLIGNLGSNNIMNKSYDDYTKQDWLKENTDSRISEDQYIYRIFNIEHLTNDLKNRTFTLVRPCAKTQNDELENPLRDLHFEFEEGKHQLFRDMMSNFYTQSWSCGPISNWNYFGGGINTVRVKCRASVVFERLMNTGDKFYNHHYRMGKITYEDVNKIKEELNGRHFESYLDPNGNNLIETIMRLNADFVEEDEIRLLYDRSPDAGNDFPLTNLLFGEEREFCSHKFDWLHVIEDYTFNPNNTNENAEFVKMVNDLSKVIQIA